MGPSFNHLDIVLKELQPLFRRRGFEQFADVLPTLQEGAGVVADALDRLLAGRPAQDETLMDWRERPRDDLVLAIAIAAWQAERQLEFGWY
jgi:hypothetical protein